MEDNRIIECIERAHYILSNLMAVKPGEEVLIAIDPQTDMRMANAMAAAALMCGAEYNVSMMPIRGKDKATIFPKTLELAMEACDEMCIRDRCEKIEERAWERDTVRKHALRQRFQASNNKLRRPEL